MTPLEPCALSFHALRRAEFSLLQRWLSEPHVDAWWHQSMDLSGIAAKYGPRIDGVDPTTVFIMECDNQPIGFIQWYRWTDYAEHAAQLSADPKSVGIDLAIGEAEKLGLGIGPMAIRKFIEHFIFTDENIRTVVTDVDIRNARSLRAFEKAGFSPRRTVRLSGEDFERQVLWFERLITGDGR